MEQINWGILSTANIGLDQVIPAIQRSSNGVVTAIASRSEKSKQVAADIGIEKAYTDYESLLADEDIQAVYIPLPNGLHKEWVMKAAEAGKHVLCEKPAALHAAELQEMIEACNQHGVLFMEAFMYQFHPQHAAVKQMIEEGRIGKVSTFRSSFSFYLESGSGNIRLEKELGGGALYDVGCYCVHSMVHVLGEKPDKIYAHAHHDPDSGIDLTAIGAISFPSGIEGLFNCSFASAPVNGYEVIGSHGTIEVENAYRPDLNPEGNGFVRVTTADGESEELTIAGDQYKLQVENFAEAILQRKAPDYTKEQMLQHAKLMDVIFRSISEGQVRTL